jgi:excisionase family DNA binding protein
MSNPDSSHSTDRCPDILTAREAAAFLCCGVSTVYAKADSGELPHVVLWRGEQKAAIRFRRADLLNFLDAHTVPAVTTKPERLRRAGGPRRLRRRTSTGDAA